MRNFWLNVLFHWKCLCFPDNRLQCPVMKTFPIYQLSPQKGLDNQHLMIHQKNVYYVQIMQCIIHHTGKANINSMKLLIPLLASVEKKFLLFLPKTFGRRQPQCWFSRFGESCETVLVFISWERRKWKAKAEPKEEALIGKDLASESGSADERE